MEKFSVCTSVYKNDKPEYVRVALDSMLVHQSIKPNEIVLVQDGPIPYDLSRLLNEYRDNYMFDIITWNIHRVTDRRIYIKQAYKLQA